MSACRVIAVGSPNGDDQIAWSIADALPADPALTVVEVRRLDRPGLRLIDHLDHDHVIIIDAVCSDDEPGTVHRWHSPVGETALSLHRSASSHGLGVVEAISLARVLQRMPRRCEIIGVVGQSWEWGAPVSESLLRMIPAVVQTIRDAAFD